MGDIAENMIYTNPVSGVKWIYLHQHWQHYEEKPMASITYHDLNHSCDRDDCCVVAFVQELEIKDNEQYWEAQRAAEDEGE